MIALLLCAQALADPSEASAPAPLPEAEAPLELPRVFLANVPKPRMGTTAYRTSLPAGNAVSTRVALVEDPGGPFIVEATAHAQVGFRWASFAAEVAGTAGASDVWSGARLGNLGLDARVLFGGAVTAAVGLHGTLPLGGSAGAHGPAAWWGTVPVAIVPTYGVAIAWELASKRWVWHAQVGLQTDAYWANMYVFSLFDLNTSLATIQPVGDKWFVVAEAELLNNPQTPLHLRGLARRDLGEGWTVDAGLALPVVAFVNDPTLQVIGGLRWEPPRPSP